MAQVGCGTTLDDPAGSGTDGVYVYCENGNPGGDGADETGGDGGSFNGNSWWVQCQGFDCNDPDVVCYDEPVEVQYCKRFSFPDLVSSFPGVSIWVSGGYPSIDSEIRQACSDRCISSNIVNETVWTNQLPDLEPECDNANWSPVMTGAWAPNDPTNCAVPSNLNIDDPDGSDIDWSVVGGLSAPIRLDCDLTGDCADLFYPHVRAHVVAPGEAAVMSPETGTARYLAVDDGNGSLAVDMAGSGTGVDDTEAIFGLAEYSSVACGDDVCPFYLANLSAYNNTDAWEILVDSVVGGLEKTIDDVQVDLVQSTLEACDDPDGLVLDASRSTSDDLDDDIIAEYWSVDGEPCAVGRASASTSSIPSQTHWPSMIPAWLCVNRMGSITHVSRTGRRPSQHFVPGGRW